MKTYILRDPPTVESQRSARRLPAQAAPPSGPALFLGLDVHNDSIAVSLAPSDGTEVRRYGIIGGQHDDVLRLLKKLSAAHPLAALLDWRAPALVPPAPVPPPVCPGCGKTMGLIAQLARKPP
jgi:hypothetical protein